MWSFLPVWTTYSSVFVEVSVQSARYTLPWSSWSFLGKGWYLAHFYLPAWKKQSLIYLPAFKVCFISLKSRSGILDTGSHRNFRRDPGRNNTNIFASASPGFSHTTRTPGLSRDCRRMWQKLVYCFIRTIFIRQKYWIDWHIWRKN